MSTPNTSVRNQRFATVIAARERLSGPGNSRLPEIRQKAFFRFGELGFPTTRNEDWKYTSVKQIAETDWSPADGNSTATLKRLGPLLEIPGPRLVFVGGIFSPELSSLADLPEGLKVTTLAEILKEGNELPPQFLQHADFEREPFTALNTAFHEDAAILTTEPGAVIDQTVQLIYLAPDDSADIEHHPRTLLVAHANSEVTLFEAHVGQTGRCFSNAVTELHLAEGARVRRVALQQPAPMSQHIGSTVTRMEKDSRLSLHTFTLDGALVRNAIRVEMAGQGADCTIDGLSVGSGEQHIDNHLSLDHAVGHCSSDQFYRTMLAGRARGVFTGKVVVARDAQKTEANQSSRNLLLSELAQVDNRPQLEIYADDVRCTHGATVGRMDEEALFYLRSRGIDPETAHVLLTEAFCKEVTDRLPEGPLHKAVTALVSEKLQQISYEEMKQ